MANSCSLGDQEDTPKDKIQFICSRFSEIIHDVQQYGKQSMSTGSGPRPTDSTA
jgi:hypothetical protein